MKDSIVEEIHRIREEMLAEYGGDIHKLIENMRKHPTEHTGPRVTKTELDRQRKVEREQAAASEGETER